MIIKNYNELADTSTKKDALDIIIAGANSVLPSNVLKNKVKFDKKFKLLTIEDKNFEINGDIYIIGFGKASGFMAEYIEDIIGVENIKSGMIIDKTKDAKTKKIVVYPGSHPIPDERNVELTNNLLSMISNLKKEDFVICLISGGGSALLTSPIDGISLSDMRQLTGDLLKSGAEVFEINILRKHLCKVKGGKLLKYISPARAVSIIFSDTIDKTYDSTASGPTSPDKSTFEQAFSILKKYNLLERAPRKIIDYIKQNIGNQENETLKQNNPLFEKINNFILADNSIALKAMKDQAETLGYKKVNILTDSLVGESKEVAVLMGKFFRSLSEKQVCLYAGETTITVNGHGKGGRLQEYIAALISEIGSIKNCVAASFGSDGVDFLEGVGGAIIDDNTLMKCRANNIDIQSMIDENDTFNLHNQIGSLIKSSPTNTNVADLHVFIKE